MGMGGDDGGYSARQAKMKADQDSSIAGVNNIFGKGPGNPIYGSRTIPGSAIGPDQSQFNYEDRAPVTYTPDVTEAFVSGYDPSARDTNAAEREKLYGTIGADSEARLLDKLGRDRTRGERDVRFQLARTGLAGGSADIDQGQEILEKYQEGSLDARNASQATSNNARTADEKTRVGLINNIRSGMDGADAVSSAYAGMTNNANAARDDAMTSDIGQFFNDLTLLRNQQQFQQGQQDTRARYGSTGGGIYGSPAGAGGFQGRVTGGGG